MEGVKIWGLDLCLSLGMGMKVGRGLCGAECESGSNMSLSMVYPFLSQL
jgi:hypothetical protein